FPPESTADVLHPEGVSTIDLGRGQVVGELGWIQRLMQVPDAAPLAVKAASGWIGDRTVAYGGARAYEIAFVDRDQARHFHEALAKYIPPHDGEIGPIPLPEACANAWKGKYREIRAVHTRGSHVLLIEAPGAASYQTI